MITRKLTAEISDHPTLINTQRRVECTEFTIKLDQTAWFKLIVKHFQNGVYVGDKIPDRIVELHARRTRFRKPDGTLVQPYVYGDEQEDGTVPQIPNPEMEDAVDELVFFTQQIDYVQGSLSVGFEDAFIIVFNQQIMYHDSQNFFDR